MYLEPVPHSEEKGKLWQKILAVATYLLFWIIFSAIGLWLMFQIRGLIFDLMVIGQFNTWTIRGIDRWVIFVFGLAWFVGLLWIDHYLRSGIGRRRLWHNIGRVALIEAVMAAILLGTRFLITL